MAHLEAADVWADLVAIVKDRADHYSLLESYYKGEQDLPIDPTELRSRFGQTFADFRDNLAKPIIEAADGRVRIQDFGNGEGLGQDALDVWEENNLHVESTWIHKEALIKGDSFVIVLPQEDDRAGVWPQVSETIALKYNDVYPRKKDAALKWWVVTMVDDNGKERNYVRMNLYFEDRIERYITQRETAVFEDDLSKYVTYSEDDVEWNTKHDVGEVPVFQFAPNYSLSDGAGVSDLEDAMPLIDLINKAFLDMAVASEFTAAPQRWATGVEIPLDPKTGEPKSLYKAGGDTVWTSANDAAKFGQFNAGSLAAFKDGINLLVEHLAVVSRTPLYYLLAQANWPSGEMLRSIEAALRQRVQDHQDAFTGTWKNVMVAALRLNGIDLDEVEDDLTQLKPTWLPPNAPFATREHLEELKVHAEVLGVPEEMLWRKAGYTSDEIAEMKQMREDEAGVGLDAAAQLQAQAVVDAAAATAPAVTRAGLTPDTPDPVDQVSEVPV